MDINPDAINNVQSGVTVGIMPVLYALWNKMSGNSKRLQLLELKVNQDFATKIELKEAINKLELKLDKNNDVIVSKLDKISEKISFLEKELVRITTRYDTKDELENSRT